MTASNPNQPLVQQLHQTLRVLRAPDKAMYAPLIQSLLVVQRQRANPAMTAVQILHTTLDQLQAELHRRHPLAADLLHGHFWEGLTAEQMVQQERPEPQSIRRFYQQQEQAITLLAQLWQQTELIVDQREHREHLLRRLPTATYTNLFGVESTIETVARHLTNKTDPAIVAIKGIGGIGKTALADRVVRSVLQTQHDFRDLLWISAKQEFLTQSGIAQYRNGTGTRIRLAQIFDDLAQKLALPEVAQLALAQKVDQLSAPLRQTPHLVVIDNLETVEDFQELVPWLSRLSGPTRFLLTCRNTVPSLARVTTVDLNELEQTAAVALAQHTATAKQVLDCDGEAVYNLVGGNPLAIILVVSLMRRLPSTQVFAAIRSGEAEDLYNYIYHQSWDAISRAAQKLLFTIQRAGDVAEWSWLELVSDNKIDHLQAAMTELIDFSLVYCHAGNNGERRYAIHRLTSTFLRTEILGWK